MSWPCFENSEKFKGSILSGEKNNIRKEISEDDNLVARGENNFSEKKTFYNNNLHCTVHVGRAAKKKVLILFWERTREEITYIRTHHSMCMKLNNKMYTLRASTYYIILI